MRRRLARTGSVGLRAAARRFGSFRTTVAATAALCVIAATLVGSAPPATAASNNASIAGTIFNDANLNGTVDTGETGLSAVTVTLKNGSTTVGTATTTTSGSYSFTKLAAATYTVTA